MKRKSKPQDYDVQPNSDGDEEAEAVVRKQGVYSERDPIRIEGLTKIFGENRAVDALKLSIKEGEVYTILGHNGAGKSTLIYMLTGVLKPSSGDASIYGRSIS